MKIEIKKQFNFPCDKNMYSLYVDGVNIQSKFDLSILERMVEYMKTHNGKLPEEETILTEEITITDEKI
jgi:hypothetical protein